VDVARYLVGEIVEVHARTGVCGPYAPPSDMPDPYTVAVRFESGALGSSTGPCIL
jgi:hypothetical protein